MVLLGVVAIAQGDDAADPASPSTAPATTGFSLPTVATTLPTTSTAPPTTRPTVEVPEVVAKAPPPPPTAPSPDCDPSYPDVCLDPDAEDYDCAGGSGNGPEYVDGPIRVRPPDPFDLDREGDGWGCKRG